MNTGYMQMLSKGFKPVFLNFGEGRNMGFFMFEIFVSQIKCFIQINALINPFFRSSYAQLAFDLVVA